MSELRKRHSQGRRLPAPTRRRTAPGPSSPSTRPGQRRLTVRRIRVKAAGTNVASVMRVFINNGSTNATAANNAFWGELPLAATTAANNAAIGPDFEYPMNLLMKAGYVVNVCFG